MSKEKEDSGTAVASKKKTKITEPKLFKVILLNDDYTPMDFVVAILESVFAKGPSEAVQIMLQVHNKGSGLCGMFTKQIAEAKVVMVHERARTEGFPLKCAMEEA